MKYKEHKTNPHLKAVFVTIILLLTSFTMLAVADDNASHDSIIKTYYFDSPIISQISIGGCIYDQVFLPNCPGIGYPDQPKLPAYGVNLLLSQGKEIANIEVITGNKIFLGSGFNIEPVGQPEKLSEIDSSSKFAGDSTIYNSEQVFPETLFTEVGTYWFRGYEILVLTLHPVQYIPNSGELYYFEDITINVKTVENGYISPLFRDLEKDEIEVAKKVDNPSVVRSYTEKTAQPLSSESYDLLILTTDEYIDDFQPLKTIHETNGITAEIKSLGDIHHPIGDVTPEKIRDFVRDEYVKNGIEYVLLGGDDDVVPARLLWVRAWSGGDTTQMPSDLYYACLDGPYNYNDNELWGEPDDGFGGGDVDLISEVYIGRACIGSATEVENFIGKTIAYINSGGYSEGQALMVGEHLWSGPDTWGGDYMDEIIDGSSAHSYTTVGMPSDQYTIDTLYDRDWPGNDWPKSELKSRINNGALIINHLGHASYGYVLKLGNSDVNSLVNVDPIFVYSQGCMAGGFDYYEYDCIAEHFSVKTDNAAFAVIMNARYGWGVVGSTDGASQRFHREFLDAIFGEEIAEIGKANQDSKEDNLHRINYGCMRWCYYQLNLFGDPTLTFYSDENNPPEIPDKPSGTDKGKIGEDYSFVTIGTDVDGDLIYYKFSWGDGAFSEWLGPYSSGEEVNASHSWSNRGGFEVKVKTRDEHRDESDWSEPLTISMRGFSFLGWLIDLIEMILSSIFN